MSGYGSNSFVITNGSNDVIEFKILLFFFNMHANGAMRAIPSICLNKSDLKFL